MKPIDRSEIMDLGSYESVRARFVERIIAEKRHRRAAVGDRMTILFENRDTALFQIQEMLRTERITKESSIAHEIATYNELVPKDDELSATLLIEIDDAAVRTDFLARARGIEEHIFVEVDGKRFRATIDPSRLLDDRASAVMYLKFPLDAATRQAFLGSNKPAVAVLVDHATYQVRAPLRAEVVHALASDFS
jgi:hypothetical protein